MTNASREGRILLTAAVAMTISVLGLYGMARWNSEQSLQRQIAKFTSSRDGSLYATSGPLLSRIASDGALAVRVRYLNFLDYDFKAFPADTLANFIELEEVLIYSGGSCDEVIAALNRLPKLTKITFTDGGISDRGFENLNSKSLRSFSQLTFVEISTDKAVSAARERMPECEFSVEVYENSQSLAPKKAGPSDKSPENR